MVQDHPSLQPRGSWRAGMLPDLHPRAARSDAPQGTSALPRSSHSKRQFGEWNENMPNPMRFSLPKALGNSAGLPGWKPPAWS